MLWGYNLLLIKLQQRLLYFTHPFQVRASILHFTLNWLFLALCTLLIVSPLIHPLRLDHFQMTFVAFFAGAFKAGQFQYPFQ